MKKNFKIFLYFVAIIFIFYIAIIPLWKEYLKFHSNKNIFLENKKNISSNLKNFSKKNIKNIESINIFHSLKQKDISKKIIEKINNAKKNIFIEVYLFTNKNIRNAVLKAKKRWVDIKVIMEKNIYKSANLNLKTFNLLKKNSIDIVWSNPKNYKLNHSKILIIDDFLILSTWNLTYSTFSKNTDFFVFTNSSNLVKKFKKIFLADFIWKKMNIYDDNIILSPNYSKEKFDKLFSEVKKSLKMYVPYLWKKFTEKIVKLKKKNIDIELIFWERKNNNEIIEKLKKLNIKIFIKKNIHSKVFLIDNKILYIWSTNFDSNSIEKNREIWILIKNPKIIKKFLEIFKKEKYNKN